MGTPQNDNYAPLSSPGYGKRYEAALGVSTMTLVALTTATAILPGPSFNSCAGLVLIKDTTVNGPHRISTWVITFVADHLGDQSDEAAACRAADAERIGRQWGRFRPPEFSEDIPGDNLAAGLILTDRQRAVVDPSRTVSSLTPQQFGRLPDPQVRHGQILPIRDRGRLSRTVDEHRVRVGRSRS